MDSNKLQPIIRHHNDKDFRVPNTKDIEPLDYWAIVFKVPKKSNKENDFPQSSLDINNESIDGAAITDNNDSQIFKKNNGGVFQRKRLSKSTNEQQKQKSSGKKNTNKSIGELEDDANPNHEDVAPHDANKYFSIIDDGMNNDGKMMNMASIDSNSEFIANSNPINNKNNRKLKRI